MSPIAERTTTMSIYDILELSPGDLKGSYTPEGSLFDDSILRPQKVIQKDKNERKEMDIVEETDNFAFLVSVRGWKDYLIIFVLFKVTMSHL